MFNRRMATKFKMSTNLCKEKAMARFNGLDENLNPRLLFNLVDDCMSQRHNESDEQSGSYTMYSKYSHLNMALTSVHVNMPYTYIFKSFAEIKSDEKKIVR